MYIHCIALTQHNSTIYYISFPSSDALWSTPPIYSALFVDSFIFPSDGSSFFSLILRELIRFGELIVHRLVEVRGSVTAMEKNNYCLF